MPLTSGDDGHVFGEVGGVASEVHPKVILGTALQFLVAVSLSSAHCFEELEVAALAGFGLLRLLLPE